MSAHRVVSIVALILMVRGMPSVTSRVRADTPLPRGVKAVWDLDKAFSESTRTRQRISINGLWRWQPSNATSDEVPDNGWGYFKVPGSWPGITDYMQKDCQTVYPNSGWRNEDLAHISAAWYQRELTIPAAWSGHRITVQAEYVNSLATVYLDTTRVGDIRFPAGAVDLSAVCQPGRTYTLSILVVALPLRGVMLSYNDTNSARQVRGSVARRGLCGDLYLVATPKTARLGDVRVATSTRRWELTLDSVLLDLAAGTRYTLRARIRAQGRTVRAFTSKPFQASDVKNGRMAFAENWHPKKLWDTHTPSNQYTVTVSLLDADGRLLDTSFPERFGFREFWINGRDFYLNGTRIHLSAVPLDNAQVGAAWATYQRARESLRRLRSFGINTVYTHNYGCTPGAHLSFAEILRAADDEGMLVSFSQPHFGQYDWEVPDAERTNGYARHARFYVRAAQNHPSVVMYSMSHNSTGYSEDMNPDLIDGVHDARSTWSLRNARRALRAEAIVRKLDPSRIIYHHSSGNLSAMHTANFYPNWAPIQELSDWFEHWATVGVKPFFSCEYGAPFMWDWGMYRGWYKGVRTFGSAAVPWEFCLAEWNAQFLGDRAFRISDSEKANLRWEAKQFRVGNLWHRWDYPHQLGSRDFDERYPVLAAYLTDNWRAFRTWGVSAISPWEYGVYWKLRPGVDRNRHVALKTDWEHLQRPGFSPDYLEERYERMDMAYAPSDWVATPAAEALYRNNRPLLAYIAGKPARFTSKDHNFLPGETVEKQIVIINNSRRTVTAQCAWSLALPKTTRGTRQEIVAAGQQKRVPLRFRLPVNLQPGTYLLSASVSFSHGETLGDRFALHVLPPPIPESRRGAEDTRAVARIAVFDPRGQTRTLLKTIGVAFQSIDPSTDLSKFDLLIIGKAALTPDGPAPDVSRVREGLRVLVFEQTAAALEKRLGFRVQEYGLRNVFRRVPDHPCLAGVGDQHLRDWRGAATILPPRLKYEPSDKFSGVPAVRWCGLEVPRIWRCGNRGNVASVLIEKPAIGDFLPIVDGGFSLQYSPLLEYREGTGRVLFCQLDVTGRTERDPVAMHIARNMLAYMSTPPRAGRAARQPLYVGDDAGKRWFDRARIPIAAWNGGDLTADQVLIVGRGGDRLLAKHIATVAPWLKAGGHLLALEMDAAHANTFLPRPLRTVQQEHIAAYFKPFGIGTPFAGVGPADVHNRDPRKLPLVAAGAKIVANGVLAQASEANVVFCQLAPYRFLTRPDDVPAWDVDDRDAVDGRQSARLTMGTVPWMQFGQKVKAGKVGATYTMAVAVKVIGDPAAVRLEVERAGKPWDRVVRGNDVVPPPDHWTHLEVTFKVARPYPEGWSAYVYCGQPETRLRVDAFRLYEGEYDPLRPGGGKAINSSAKNLFANARFESGTEPWFFTWKTQQQNLRKTFRRSSFLLARLLANMGVRGQTPLLSRFSAPVNGLDHASIIKNGVFKNGTGKDRMPDHWLLSTSVPRAACIVETGRTESDGRCLRITYPELEKDAKGSVMLAQNDVAVEQGQWYAISLRAKAAGLDGAAVDVALQDTTNWHALFDYQHFTPRPSWKEFTFLVQAKATAQAKTRFQIWYGTPGTLWLDDIRMVPCAPPTQGRWTSGLYIDQPQEWDDPYRFFRW